MLKPRPFPFGLQLDEGHWHCWWGSLGTWGTLTQMLVSRLKDHMAHRTFGQGQILVVLLNEKLKIVLKRYKNMLLFLFSFPFNSVLPALFILQSWQHCRFHTQPSIWKRLAWASKQQRFQGNSLFNGYWNTSAKRRCHHGTSNSQISHQSPGKMIIEKELLKEEDGTGDSIWKIKKK